MDAIIRNFWNGEGYGPVRFARYFEVLYNENNGYGALKLVPLTGYGYSPLENIYVIMALALETGIELPGEGAGYFA